MTAWRFPTGSTHLSASQITEYLACPACYEMSRVRKLPKPMSVTLPIGGAVHKAVESQRANMLNDLGQDRTGSSDFIDVAADHFVRSLTVDEETGGEIIVELGEYESLGKAKDDAVRFTKYLLPEIAKLDQQRGLIAAELDLAELDTNPWPFPMHGRIDALYGPSPDMCTAGEDLKTSKKQMAPAFEAAVQLAIYNRSMPATWFADVLAKTKTPSLISYTLTLPDPEFVWTIVMEVAVKIRNGEFPVRPSW